MTSLLRGNQRKQLPKHHYVYWKLHASHGMIAAPPWSSHRRLDFGPSDRADVARSRPTVPSRALRPSHRPTFYPWVTKSPSRPGRARRQNERPSHTHARAPSFSLFLARGGGYCASSSMHLRLPFGPAHTTAARHGVARRSARSRAPFPSCYSSLRSRPPRPLLSPNPHAPSLQSPQISSLLLCHPICWSLPWWADQGEVKGPCHG
jgi:hypothetical protein